MDPDTIMFDTGKFIESIKKRKIIWDTQNSPNDRELRFDAWDEVGAEVYNRWGVFTQEEKIERRKLMYAKWKNIRDYFVKTLRAYKKKNPAGRKRYAYFDKLQFLVPVVESKQTEKESKSTNTSDTMQYSLTDTQPFEFVEVITDNDEDDQGEEGSNTNVLQLPSECQESQQCRVTEKSPENREMDADRAFFMSILPAVKVLNEQQKLDLKLEILQAIKNQSPNFQKSYSCNIPLYFRCPKCNTYASVQEQSTNS